MRPNTANPFVNLVTNRFRSSKDLLPSVLQRSSILPSAAGKPFKMSPVQTLALGAPKSATLTFREVGGLKSAKKIGPFSVCKKVVR